MGHYIVCPYIHICLNVVCGMQNEGETMNEEEESLLVGVQDNFRNVELWLVKFGWFA